MFPEETSAFLLNRSESFHHAHGTSSFAIYILIVAGFSASCGSSSSPVGVIPEETESISPPVEDSTSLITSDLVPLDGNGEPIDLESLDESRLGPIGFTGTVERLPFRSGAGILTGFWRVSGRIVWVRGNTSLPTELVALGDSVDITGLEVTDTFVIAETVAFEGEEPPPPVGTIRVDDNCSLFDAVTAANTDTATNGCTAGQPGRDRILLTGNVLVPPNPDSFIALPAILTPILLDGAGFTIASSSDETPIEVQASGELETTDVRITGGGDGIRNRGTLIIGDETIITGNSDDGIDNDASTAELTIDGTGIEIRGNSLNGIENSGVAIITGDVRISENSNGISNGSGDSLEVRGSGVLIRNNSNSGNGAGIFNSGTALIEDGVRIIGNSAGFRGGGIFNEGTLNVENNVQIVGNEAARTSSFGEGGGVYNSSGSTALFDRVALSGNRLFTPEGQALRTTGGGIRNLGNLVIGDSCIVDNSNISVVNTGIEIDARNNWWGQATGPGPEGSNSSIEGDVDFSNFRVTPPAIPGCNGQ